MLTIDRNHYHCQAWSKQSTKKMWRSIMTRTVTLSLMILEKGLELWSLWNMNRELCTIQITWTITKGGYIGIDIKNDNSVNLLKLKGNISLLTSIKGRFWSVLLTRQYQITYIFEEPAESNRAIILTGSYRCILSSITIFILSLNGLVQ